MKTKRWLVPGLIALALAVPLAMRLGAGPSRASGAVPHAAPSRAETCDQACTAIASCGWNAAASLGLAPPPDPNLAPPLDVPAARAACLKPCTDAARARPAFARVVAACSECVKTFDCRDVRTCLASCFPDPALLAGR
jgi:hypothetical protein